MEESKAMSLAREYVRTTRERRELEGKLTAVKGTLDQLEQQLLDAMEEGNIPASFKLDGASVHHREQLWASPHGGDHARLTGVLKELGLTEFLPKTVNAQSISAFVREHVNERTGEVEGLDPRLLEALNITTKQKAVVNLG